MYKAWLKLLQAFMSDAGAHILTLKVFQWAVSKKNWKHFCEQLYAVNEF